MPTIEEALGSKGKLTRRIREALVEFSKETSLTVSAVHVDPIPRIGSPPMYQVEIRCEL